MHESPLTEPLALSPGRSAADVVTRTWQWVVPLAMTAVFLAVKLFAVARINVNWDEFLFLSQVHALARGELSSVFQSAYAHLFTWLVNTGGDEMTQIVTARWLMMALLTVSVGLMVKLASRWASPAAVWVAPVCYFSAWPILIHAGSFRADSLILPLTLGVLVLLTQPRRSPLREVISSAA